MNEIKTNKVKITVLGSGTVMSSFYKKFDYRNPSGHLLQYAGKNVLLDFGEGMRGRLDHIKVDYFDLDAIFISHFHPDHFTFETIIHSFLDRITRGNTKKTLYLYGPKGIAEKLETIWDSKNYNGSFKEDVLKVFDLKISDYEDSKQIDLFNEIKVTPFSVIHGKMDAYALRIDLDNTTITYSGDSGICDGLIEAARNSDLFICEAAIDTNDEVVDTTKHLSCYDVGIIAKEANSQHLVIVHYKGKDTIEKMKEEISRSDFKGKVDIASDFSTFEA